MRKFLLALIIGAVAFCITTRAEEFQLKDGTKIIGKLIGVDGDALVVKTSYGEIQVPRTDVISITFPENQPKDAAKAGEAPRPVDESLSDGKYVNRSGNFAMQVPKDWAVSPGLLAKTPALIAALESGDETRILLVTPEKFAGSIDTYRVLVETQLKANYSNYQGVEQNEVQVDGQKGIRMVAVVTQKGADTQYKFLIYLIPYEGRVVRLSFFTLATFYNDALPTFEKIAASYHSLPK
jgi:hypothetical protein